MWIREGFGVSVRDLVLGVAVHEVVVVLKKSFMEPSDADTVRTTEMPHGRVPARFTHTDHRCVVLPEIQDGLRAAADSQEVQSRYPFRPEAECSSNKFCSKRRMKYCRLLLGDTGDRKFHSEPANFEIYS